MSQTTSTDHEPSSDPRLSLVSGTCWEGVARAIIREGLNPDGLNIPERQLEEWIIALGRLYELKRD